MKYLMIISLCLIFACTNNKDDAKLTPAREYCGTTKPLEELTWLKEIKAVMVVNANATGGQIIAYKYEGEDVFWVDDCYSCDDKVVVVYNCEGEVICEFGGISGQNTCPDFAEKATDSVMLFTNVAPDYLFPTGK